jgi:hypothetical protein
MPDSFGKRNRDAVKARKAAERDEMRIARNRRRNQKDVPVVRALDDFSQSPTPQGDAGTPDVSQGA